MIIASWASLPYVSSNMKGSYKEFKIGNLITIDICVVSVAVAVGGHTWQEIGDSRGRSQCDLCRLLWLKICFKYVIEASPFCLSLGWCTTASSASVRYLRAKSFMARLASGVWRLGCEAGSRSWGSHNSRNMTQGLSSVLSVAQIAPRHLVPPQAALQVHISAVNVSAVSHLCLRWMDTECVWAAWQEMPPLVWQLDPDKEDEGDHNHVPSLDSLEARWAAHSASWGRRGCPGGLRGPGRPL